MFIDYCLLSAVCGRWEMFFFELLECGLENNVYICSVTYNLRYEATY